MYYQPTYKILVISQHTAVNGLNKTSTALHSVVIEFDRSDFADQAGKAILKQMKECMEAKAPSLVKEIIKLY